MKSKVRNLTEYVNNLHNKTNLTKFILYRAGNPKRREGGGADAVDFRNQTKIKIYSFNFKDPSIFYRFLVPNINKYIRLLLNGSKKSP